MTKRLIRTLLWILAVFGNQMLLVFLKFLIWNPTNLATADVYITFALSVVGIECLIKLQKDGST